MPVPSPAPGPWTPERERSERRHDRFTRFMCYLFFILLALIMAMVIYAGFKLDHPHGH